MADLPTRSQLLANPQDPSAFGITGWKRTSPNSLTDAQLQALHPIVGTPSYHNRTTHGFDLLTPPVWSVPDPNVVTPQAGFNAFTGPGGALDPRLHMGPGGTLFRADGSQMMGGETLPPLPQPTPTPAGLQPASIPGLDASGFPLPQMTQQQIANANNTRLPGDKAYTDTFAQQFRDLTKGLSPLGPAPTVEQNDAYNAALAVASKQAQGKAEEASAKVRNGPNYAESGFPAQDHTGQYLMAGAEGGWSGPTPQQQARSQNGIHYVNGQWVPMGSPQAAQTPAQATVPQTPHWTNLAEQPKKKQGISPLARAVAPLGMGSGLGNKSALSQALGNAIGS